MSCTRFFASPVLASRSNSMILPSRTSLTSLKPSEPRARVTAWPCGRAPTLERDHDARFHALGPPKARTLMPWGRRFKRPTPLAVTPPERAATSASASSSPPVPHCKRDRRGARVGGAPAQAAPKRPIPGERPCACRLLARSDQSRNCIRRTAEKQALAAAVRADYALRQLLELLRPAPPSVPRLAAGGRYGLARRRRDELRALERDHPRRVRWLFEAEKKSRKPPPRLCAALPPRCWRSPPWPARSGPATSFCAGVHSSSRSTLQLLAGCWRAPWRW